MILCLASDDAYIFVTLQKVVQNETVTILIFTSIILEKTD